MHDIETANPIWIRARAMFARAVAMLGDAAALASIPLLSRALRRDILAWIAPLEHVVRKLLLAEAAELHRAERARAKRRVRIEHVPLRGMAQTWNAGSQTRASAKAIEKTASEDMRKIDRTRPETWRARFSFALPRAHHVTNSHAPRIRALWGPYEPPSTPKSTPRVVRPDDSPFRLARRFEALRRVLENPMPHAARLARVLAREVQRVGQIAQRYLFAPCRTNDYDRADPRLGLDAMGHAFNAPDAFADTS